MKRIAIILAALALLLSACVNPVPTPDTDQDPIVSTSGPLLVQVGDRTTITTSVEDDTPGERTYSWYAAGRLVPEPESVTHARTSGFTLDTVAPSVSNGQVSAYTETYTFSDGPWAIGTVPLDVALFTNSVTFALGGVSTTLTNGETRTISYEDHTASVSFVGGAFPAPELMGARFTINGDATDLNFDETATLATGGYSVDATIIDYAVAPNGTFTYVTIQAEFVDADGLLQQIQVRFDPQTGQRVDLGDGTILDIYLEGGVYEQAGSREAVGARFEIANESVDLRFGQAQDLSIKGYTVTVEPKSYTLNNVGEMDSVTLEATYTYDGLTQTVQVRFDTVDGKRVYLPDGTYVDAYFNGGLFETSAESITLRVNGETQQTPIGAALGIGNTTVRVISASGTETPDGAELTALLNVHADIVSIDDEETTTMRSGELSKTWANPTASINGNTVILSYGSEPAGQVLGAYEWRVDDGTLYYVDTMLFGDLSSNNGTLSFTPLRPALFEITYTATDDRGNTGSDTHVLTITE